MVDANKTYVGVVEDNEDPLKMGRVKVRVMHIFDDIPIEDIPWASPWKDLNGNEFSVPEKGKIMMVIFEDGDPDLPEFIYADHYNINLENKIKSLSNGDYKSMKSLLFDHKTQIYVNDGEGLKIDHKYNNINITENSINFNLKDNNSTLNIGDESANQKVILGNHWLDWFDEFVDNLLGQKAGPYFGNLGAPIVPAPSMASILLKYKTLRGTKFLSNNVSVVDNGKIKTVLNTDREDTPQYGDAWNSTVTTNEITKLESSEIFTPEEPEELDENIELVISFLNEKGYVVNEGTGILNILALRDKDDGVVTGKFDETLYVVWKSENGDWKILEAPITTVPGFKKGLDSFEDVVEILANGQYVDKLYLAGGSEPYLYFDNCFVLLNQDPVKYDWKSKRVAASGVTIIPSNRSGSSESIPESAEMGSQIFKNINHYNKFIELCQEQINKYKKKSFTYTISLKSEFIKLMG